MITLQSPTFILSASFCLLTSSSRGIIAISFAISSANILIQICHSFNVRKKIDLLVHPLEQLLVHEVELGEVLVCELLLHLGDIWEVARTDLVLPLQLGVSEMSKLLNLKISKSSKHLQSVQVFDQFFLLPLLPEHGRHIFLQAGDYVGVHLKYELDRILKDIKILNQEIIFHHIKCESLMFNPQIQLLSPLRNQCQCHLPWRVSLS